ncbi:hypothetical protein EDF71_10194 [Comamonas sp. JUb58]|nr:hypothetical protein EDF71_10194 [Comamonas sp. JUb58]
MAKRTHMFYTGSQRLKKGQAAGKRRCITANQVSQLTCICLRARA